MTSLKEFPPLGLNSAVTLLSSGIRSRNSVTDLLAHDMLAKILFKTLNPPIPNTIKPVTAAKT